MNEALTRDIAVARTVVAYANAGSLGHDVAVNFCKGILPRLLVELELAARVDARLAAMFPEPKPCEATICSGRWGKKADAEKPKKARKKAAKKTRKKKEVKDDCFPS